jgi:hypothetical protein
MAQPEELVHGYFPLGKVYFSREVADKVDHFVLMNALRYHANCNWDNLSEQDQKDNLAAAKEQRGFVFSKFQHQNISLWIVTDFTTNITTVMFEGEAKDYIKGRKNNK